MQLQTLLTQTIKTIPSQKLSIGASMPINRIAPTARGKAAIASALLMAAGAGWGLVPGATPPEVILARTTLVRPWEGRELRAYFDQIAKPPVWTVCDGDTKHVTPNMLETPEGCDKRLDERLAEFVKPLRKCFPNWDSAPISWRAMEISLSYNAGVGAGCNSTAAALGRNGRFHESCLAATAYNRAGGKIIVGLVKRREMGDATRIGEAELCESGL